jgi:hypothetical protein
MTHRLTPLFDAEPGRRPPAAPRREPERAPSAPGPEIAAAPLRPEDAPVSPTTLGDGAPVVLS